MIKIMQAAILGSGVILGMMSNADAAEAANAAAQPHQTGMHLKVFGKTSPPIGHVQFCKSHRTQCAQTGGKDRLVELNNKRWSELTRINGYVNKTVKPVTDQELYDVAEHWTYPDNQGDCEDYVLLKKHYLEELGWPPEALLITVVLDQQNAGHAVLMARTDLGDFVLDNQNPEVLSWQDTPYRYIKRQSQKHASAWVSLDPRYSSETKSTTAGPIITKR